MEPLPVHIYSTPPKDFRSAVSVASCCIIVGNEWLVLQYASEKSALNQWGLPAGKLEPQELPLEAAKRELFEETGIILSLEDLHYVNTLFLRRPTMDFTYHTFKAILPEKPSVSLSNEHIAYQWVPQSDVERLSLLPGAKEIHASIALSL